MPVKLNMLSFLALLFNMLSRLVITFLLRSKRLLISSLSGGGGKPSFPSPSAGDLRELPRDGGAPRDSAGSGATEEGLTSRGGTVSSQ